VLLYILGKNTVFFQLEKEQTFLPSLYTLWKYPEVRQLRIEKFAVLRIRDVYPGS
jgi:hypothetical protein